jgi:hypothetical protein
VVITDSVRLMAAYWSQRFENRLERMEKKEKKARK